MTDHRTAPRKTNDSPIAQYRLKRGLTQTQLAELVGTSLATLQRWEVGQTVPKATMLVRLAAALECDVADLIA